MKKPKSHPEKKWIGLLGGSALFGYLGCLPPESTVSPQSPAAGADTASRVVSADSNLVRPIPVSERDTAIIKTDTAIAVRTGPTLGEPCTQSDTDYQRFCTFEGMPLKCLSGILVQGAVFPVSSGECNTGDTLMHYRHFGFTGIDRPGRLDDSAAIPLRGRMA